MYVDSVGILYNGAISVHRGPLVFGLQLGEDRNVTARHPTPDPDHPECEDFTLNSTTPWNVALVFDPARPAADAFAFSRAGAVNASQPWDHAAPPLKIHALARVVPGWGLALGAAAGPPASPACASAACGAPINVTLVPYGSQHLRERRLQQSTRGCAKALIVS